MVYLSFYNLREHPFSNVVDNRFYYNSPQHAQALVKLRYAIDTKKGLAVVIGDIGAGKTTLARRLLEEMDETRYEAMLLVIIHASVSSEWLLKKFAMQLGISSPHADKVELLSILYRRLLEINEDGKTAVLLMDEVQMLKSREIMEEFRGLLNMEMPDGKMINLVFFGLSDLEDVLSLDEPLKQRVAMKITLTPFSEDDTKHYIKHRLRIAGSEDSIFLDEAFSSIYRYTNGKPRLINTVCDNALLEGSLLKAKNIDEKIIRGVAIDLGLTQE
ncbi:MAG TPA: AAA family ATPase [Thermodesulfovibrionales bacterium]|jgi:type II secretory pathway predicted ATPase ExeA|nr:AAA family ATPase [Thermodesulfovibrionales bacterium]